MAMLGSPPLEQEALDCLVVEQQRILGVLLDAGLTFQPYAMELLARGWASFLSLLHTGEAGGFTLPIMAAEVLSRIVPYFVYGACFLVVVPGILAKLNLLQWRWGKTLLGARYARELKHMLVVAQCGWRLRLGTLAVMEALVMVARIALLPTTHPLSQVVSIAQKCMAQCWLTYVADVTNKLNLPISVPGIAECGLFLQETLRDAHSDVLLRKRVLAQYRQRILRPAFEEYDRIAFFSTVEQSN